MFLVDSDSKKADATPIRVLLLDDRPDLLILRSAILRQNGYEAITSSSIEEAESKLEDCDIAILDYHLGQGKFGTTVAESLREKRPQVPIIIGILLASAPRKIEAVYEVPYLSHAPMEPLNAVAHVRADGADC